MAVEKRSAHVYERENGVLAVGIYDSWVFGEMNLLDDDFLEREAAGGIDFGLCRVGIGYEHVHVAPAVAVCVGEDARLYEFDRGDADLAEKDLCGVYAYGKPAERCEGVGCFAATCAHQVALCADFLRLVESVGRICDGEVFEIYSDCREILDKGCGYFSEADLSVDMS